MARLTANAVTVARIIRETSDAVTACQMNLYILMIQNTSSVTAI